MRKFSDSWERFLDPRVLQPSLLSATLYIAVFEVVKDALVSRVRDLYDLGAVGGTQINVEYEREVRSRDKSVLGASLDWLREHGAIEENDIILFDKLIKTRNILAHELFQIFLGEIDSEHVSQLRELVALLRKVELWWIVNFEMPANPDFDGQMIDESAIMPGTVLMIQILADVASGDTSFLQEWRRLCAQNRGPDRKPGDE